MNSSRCTAQDVQAGGACRSTARWDYDQTVKHEPAGKLVLTILAETWGKFEQRKRWSDAKVQKVEGLIPDFVAGLMRTAVSLRHQE
jgi:hypothetical protein